MAHASISFEALILRRSFERRLLRRAENLSSFAGPFSVVGFDNKRTPSSLVVLYAPAIVITITVACVGLPPVDGEVLIGLKPPHAKIIQGRLVDIGRYGTFVPNNPWGSVDYAADNKCPEDIFARLLPHGVSSPPSLTSLAIMG